MRTRQFALFVALLALLSLRVSGARAQSIVKQPGQHPDYAVELEPHLALGLFDPPGYGLGTGIGGGVRATIPILRNGFIPKLNNSVGIGFGLDYVGYDNASGSRGSCAEFAQGPSGVPVCVRVSGSAYGYSGRYFYLPVVLQWNFWLHRRWSVFGEPGLALYFEDSRLRVDPFEIFAGGRFHFNDRITLTMRIGYPVFTLGVSFLL